MSEDASGTTECANCGAEYERESYCGECGYGRMVGELEEAPAPAPVYARAVDPRAFPVYEGAWCPHCVAWLGTFPSREEARAYEQSLENHPLQFCLKRQSKLNTSEEWRLRHDAGKRGSLAGTKPSHPRVPGEVRP